jgi:hypothetical protein
MTFCNKIEKIPHETYQIKEMIKESIVDPFDDKRHSYALPDLIDGLQAQLFSLLTILKTLKSKVTELERVKLDYLFKPERSWDAAD